MSITAAITSVGAYLPEYILTNQELEKMVDTNDQWIQERTGIVERRILKGDRATSDMGIEAVNQILKEKNLDPLEIDMLICCTVTPDHTFPATAKRPFCELVPSVVPAVSKKKADPEFPVLPVLITKPESWKVVEPEFNKIN